MSKNSNKLKITSDDSIQTMQGYNCIMVFSQDNEKILFCKRTKDPYKGLYNLVGGKIEKGEDGFAAAYRELKEETGIDATDINLSHMMDFTYHNQNCYVEVYAGKIEHEVTIVDELHPLEWLPADENFFNSSRFAGEGNIGHMVEQVKIYGMGKMQDDLIHLKASICDHALCIGVDGCKGGWIAAVLDNGKLNISRYSSLDEITSKYPNFDEFLIDMVIGLQSNADHIRPDTFGRRLIKERASTIFPAPCRQAIYADLIAESYNENERVLGKKFTPLTVGIIPKIKEVDSFLQKNPEYKNRIKESHPEVCIARLNGKTMLSKKAEYEGIIERLKLIVTYIPDISLENIMAISKNMKCNIDDIIDAIILAITANLSVQGYCESLPEEPMQDETGLFMQYLIPNFGK